MGRRNKKKPRLPAPAPTPVVDSRERAWPAIVGLPLIVSLIGVALSKLFPDVPLSIPALAGLMITLSVAWAMVSWLRRLRARSGR